MTVDAVNDRALAAAGDEWVDAQHWHLPDSETEQLRRTVELLTAEVCTLRRREARCHLLLNAVCDRVDEPLVARVAYVTKLVELSEVTNGKAD